METKWRRRAGLASKRIVYQGCLWSKHCRLGPFRVWESEVKVLRGKEEIQKVGHMPGKSSFVLAGYLRGI